MKSLTNETWFDMKNQKSLLHLTVAVVIAVAAAGCSDLEKPLPSNAEPELEAHPEGWADANSANFHGLFIRNHGWDLDNCKQCHGADYTGGISETSCLTCHPATPEDCVVCHGGVDNQTGAPPEDLDGNVTTTARGVGAHTAHLDGESLSDGIPCSSCHVVPATFATSGHADSDLPAEITFGAIALTDSANPTYDVANASCADAYCHGNWRLPKSASNSTFVYTADFIEGNRAAPVWTDPSTAACGTCHGLPPTGHTPFELSQCTNCHGSVIDAAGTIIDKSKHVNGQVNVFGQEYPIF